MASWSGRSSTAMVQLHFLCCASDWACFESFEKKNPQKQNSRNLSIHQGDIWSHSSTSIKNIMQQLYVRYVFIWRYKIFFKLEKQFINHLYLYLTSKYIPCICSSPYWFSECIYLRLEPVAFSQRWFWAPGDITQGTAWRHFCCHHGEF